MNYSTITYWEIKNNHLIDHDLCGWLRLNEIYAVDFFKKLAKKYPDLKIRFHELGQGSKYNDSFGWHPIQKVIRYLSAELF